MWFSKQTTVHGLHIVGLSRLHFLERLFWVLMVTVATYGAIAIAYSNWMRYNANPTVMSIQKDFRNWLNPFPATTGCFLNRVNKEKAQKFIYEKWGVDSKNASYDYYFSFLEKISNISFETLYKFENYKHDSNLKNVNMFEIAQKVHPKLVGTLVTFDTSRKPYWTLIMTERGICFSVNSKMAHFLAIEKNKTLQNEKLLSCHYLNGLCYARFDSDPKLSLKYYIHSSSEIIHTTSEPPIIVRESEEVEISYRMQETESAISLRQLSPAQRKCRFYDEPISEKISVYSTSLCYVECRYKLALKLCGCKPFFYHSFDGKTCDLNGLLCLANYSALLTQTGQQLNCYCPAPCDITVYFPQVPKITEWEHGYFEQRITFRWALLPPTTKFLRDVLFGFEDLVVSFGGTLALFLGISFISVIEIVFLLTENIYFYFRQKLQNRI